MSEVSANTETTKKSTSDETAKAANVEKKIVDTTSPKGQTETTKVPNEDVERAIAGLAEIPDDELQEFFNDEDFMSGLDVVDAWEGDTEKSRKNSRGTRPKEREHRKPSRERPRRERNKSPQNRDRLRREERKREDARRDPSKSSKDIERDKIRTKKDTASKFLAEQEKAIKHLLDSDNVVPPGTEVEAIQDITEKQLNSERGHQTRGRRSRERRRSQDRQRSSPTRRRSNDRIRLSPNRRISDERRQIRLSPERRRNMASPPIRRSWERRASRERSLERAKRREEREQRITARRSRSRDRLRSRSADRYRKRWSRSPVGRRSSQRRHSRSRTPDRRARKRSPFINELARQFGTEGLIPGGPPAGFLASIPPLMGQGFQQEQIGPVPPPSMPFMHHPGPPGPPGIHMQPGPQPFVNFDSQPVLGPPMNFDQLRGPLHHPSQTDYAAPPLMYNQGNQPRPMQQPILGPSLLSMPMHSPQPVPAPGPSEIPPNFNQPHGPLNIPGNPQNKHPSSHRRPVSPPKSSRMEYKDLAASPNTFNGTQRTDRLKTPEPPVISQSKPFEKTSLSSLLEASVSAKDSPGVPVLYPGFNPDILRQCELALRELPAEDLRFRRKGRFFFDPNKDDGQKDTEKTSSNSILLRTGRGKIYWDEAEKAQKTTETVRSNVETHQKICQTDEPEISSKAIQAVILPKTTDFSVQVYPHDLQKVTKEEKRPIQERLDWVAPDVYDHQPKRDADDLRWSLSNSSQKRTSWNRGLSPQRVIEEEHELTPPTIRTIDHVPRGINAGSTTRGRDNFSYDRSTSRDHYSRESFSPSYRRSIDRQDEYHEIRSDHSRGESPMALEESPDEVEILEDDFSRGPDNRSRGNSSFGSTSALNKLRALRGKPANRSHRPRSGTFRWKY